jgi:hypothetical protein
MQAFSAAGQQMYQADEAAQAAGAPGAEGFEGAAQEADEAGSEDEDVVEADYEIVDEEQ